MPSVCTAKSALWANEDPQSSVHPKEMMRVSTNKEIKDDKGILVNLKNKWRRDKGLLGEITCHCQVREPTKQ